MPIILFLIQQKMFQVDMFNFVQQVSNLFKYLPNTKTEEALKILPIFQVIQKSIFLYINSSMYQSML